ncbi:MAG: enoyl-CoA hydratase/isomerase family protein [Sphingorhabdus sp.]
MTILTDYADKYHFAAIARDATGVLTVTLGTGAGTWVFDQKAQDDLGRLYADIADDRETKVVIFTGTGDAFCGALDVEEVGATIAAFDNDWADRWIENGRRGLFNMLSIERPVIVAFNGPAHIHAELWVTGDIVLATPDTTIRDEVYTPAGNIPGGAIVTVWEHLIGSSRTRYFQFAGQTLDAETLHDLGVVHEILPRDGLLARAQELAAKLAERPTLSLRYTKSALIHSLRSAALADTQHYMNTAFGLVKDFAVKPATAGA